MHATKTPWLLAGLLLLLTSSSVYAEVYIRDYTYKASEADSKISSRIQALDQVKLLLLQEIGTHIRQQFKIKTQSTGQQYAEEEIEAITAGVTSVEVLQEKWDGHEFYLKAKIEADTQRVLQALEEFKKSSDESRQQKEALLTAERELKESREAIAELRRKLEQAQSQSQMEEIVNDYQKEIDQFSLAQMNSKGVELRQRRQYEEALSWYRKAAEKGHTGAQVDLGYMYEHGLGTGKDLHQASAWYRKAAEQGHATAQFNLGAFYDAGRGVAQSDQQAFIWYKKAAEQGYRTAQFNLGALYDTGRGVAQSDQQAFIWYKKAAEQGHPTAQNNVGILYEIGRGIGKNYAQAVKWYKQACDNGYKKSCSKI